MRKSVKTIEQYPNAYPASDKFFEARRCVVVPQVSLFYRLEGETITVLALMDNRRSDKKGKKRRGATWRFRHKILQDYFAGQA